MKNLTIRLPDWMHGNLKLLAKEHRRSLNSEILIALDVYIGIHYEETGKMLGVPKANDLQESSRD